MILSIRIIKIIFNPKIFSNLQIYNLILIVNLRTFQIHNLINQIYHKELNRITSQLTSVNFRSPQLNNNKKLQFLNNKQIKILQETQFLNRKQIKICKFSNLQLICHLKIKFHKIQN